LANEANAGVGVKPLKDQDNIYTGAYAMEINAAALRYGLSPFLIAAVIKAESNFNPRAQSGAGAAGLMQLMPATAQGLGVTDRFDPAQNINGGSKYLSQQIKAFGTIELGLAAYNAGPGNVRKYGGIPPFKETQNYVKKVMGYYQNNNSFPGAAAGGISIGGLFEFLKNPVFWLILFGYYIFK
jgi:soluble lytic murein transglycosylase-like protein